MALFKNISPGKLATIGGKKLSIVSIHVDQTESAGGSLLYDQFRSIMKILLINPWSGDVFPPPSLGYIQSAIKNNTDADVIAMDFERAMAQRDEFDLVGVSFHSFSVKYAAEIRNHFKRARLICGGHHPSALPDQMIGIGYDQIVIGEGENAIVSIISGASETIIHGDVVNINAIDPDYSGFGGDWTALGMPIISSRGCPFDCSFCASSYFWHRRWRMRSADHVLNEINHLPTKRFMFEDDNFTIDRQRVIDICDGLKNRGFIWQCASRAETLCDDDLCRQLKRAGCHTVWIGVESLSQTTLDRNKKRTTVDRILRGIKTADECGLNTMAQFIIGLPGDTQSDIDLTVANIRRSRIRRRGCQILWILPKTEIHERAKKFGFNDDVYITDGAPFYTYEQNINTLNFWFNQIQNA